MSTTTTTPQPTAAVYTLQEKSRDIAKILYCQLMIRQNMYDSEESCEKAIALVEQIFKSAEELADTVTSYDHLSEMYPALSVPSFAAMFNAPKPTLKARPTYGDTNSPWHYKMNECKYEQPGKDYNYTTAQSAMWPIINAYSKLHAMDFEAGYRLGLGVDRTRHDHFPSLARAMEYFNKEIAPLVKDQTAVVGMFHSMVMTGKSTKGTAWSVQEMVGAPELPSFLLQAYLFLIIAFGVYDHVVNANGFIETAAADLNITCPSTIKTEFSRLFEAYNIDPDTAEQWE